MEHANMYESELDAFTVPSQAEEPVEPSDRRKIQNQALGKDPWKWRPLGDPEFTETIKGPEVQSELPARPEGVSAEEPDSEAATANSGESALEETGYQEPSIGQMLQYRNEALRRFEEEGMCLRPAVNVAPLGDIDIPPPYVRPRRAYRNSLRFRKVRPPKKQEAKGFPSGTPKGFTSLLPIFDTQPSFESLTGDHPMAGIVTTRQGAPLENRLQAGPPNMHLAAVRRAPLRKRLHTGSTETQQSEKPDAAPLDFPLHAEWANTTRLSFEVSGFRFGGDPPRRQRTIKRSDSWTDHVVDVTALLADDVEHAPVPEPVFFVDEIQWDEIDQQPQAAARPVTAGEGAWHDGMDLELYEPDPPSHGAVDSRTAVPQAPEREPADEEAEEPEPVDPNRLLAPLDEDDESYEEAEVPIVVMAAAADSSAEQELPATTPPSEEAPDDAERLLEEWEAVRMAGDLEERQPRLLQVDAPQFSIPDEPLAPGGARLHLPVLQTLPLRPRMVSGPAPGMAEAETATESLLHAGENGSKHRQQRSRRKGNPAFQAAAQTAPAAPVVDDPVEEPFDLGEEVEAGLAAMASSIAAAGASPIAEAVPEASPAPSKPRFIFDESPSSEAAAPDFTIPEATEASTGMGTGAKIGIAAGVLAAGAIAFFTLTGGDSATTGKTSAGAGKAQTAAAQKATGAPAVVTAGAVVGEVGWSTENVLDSKGKRARQLSVYRPTARIADYRIEFQALIDYRAVGWAVRAANSKNHVVLRIVHEKGSKARLERFTVIDGQVGPVVEKELPFPVSFGMLYRVRMDTVGSHFSVTINDKKIDVWNETKLAAGGFGVVNEGTERGQVRNVQAWHLREVAAKRR